MNQSSPTIHNSRPKIIAYWPIAAIYIIACLLSLYTLTWQQNPDYMSHVMGFVLVFFGLIKLSDIVGFARGFAEYDPLAHRSQSYAQSYPFLEIALGILFILQIFIIPATLITLFIYSASLAGAIQIILNKQSLHCVCLGTYFKLPLSTVTILEATFMIGMCLWMLVMIFSMAAMVM